MRGCLSERECGSEKFIISIGQSWKPSAGGTRGGTTGWNIREGVGGRGRMRWVGSCLYLPGGAAHPHALHWGFLCPGWRGASVGANVFRSVLGPWGLSRGTQPLSYSGSGPEQGGGGGAGSALQRGSQGGWPGRTLGCGPGRLERTVQIMNGWEAGRDNGDQEHGK